MKGVFSIYRAGKPSLTDLLTMFMYRLPYKAKQKCNNFTHLSGK